MAPSERQIIWTNYLRARAEERGVPLETVAEVVRFASERYFDTNHSRMVVVGRFGRLLLLVPYEEGDQSITPVTVHTTTHPQMTWHLQEGRFQA